MDRPRPGLVPACRVAGDGGESRLDAVCGAGHKEAVCSQARLAGEGDGTQTGQGASKGCRGLSSPESGRDRGLTACRPARLGWLA